MMSEKDSLGETHPEQIVQSETGQGKKLFRANAVRVARERAFYGSVSVNTPIPYIVISAIAAIFIIAIVFGLFFLEYDHKVSGKGVARVKEGEYTISSPIAGNLSELKAELGAHVKVGQVIAIIKAPRQTATGKSYFKELTHISEARKRTAKSFFSVESFRASQKIIFQKQKKKKFLATKAIYRKDLSELEKQRKNLDSVLSIYAHLRNEGATSMREYLGAVTQKTSNMLATNKLKRETYEIDNKILESNHEISDLEKQIESYKLQLIEQELNINKEIILTAANAEVAIVSDVDGFISQLNVREGELVRATSKIAVIVPEKFQLEGSISIPGKDIGLVAVGQDVDIKLDAFPYIKYGRLHGVVSRVSWGGSSKLTDIGEESGTSFSVEISIEPTDSRELILYNKIRSGFTFVGEIVLERSSWFKWIFIRD